MLLSTNLIENLFSPVREIGRRVKHWQSGTMVLRWTAAGVIEDEPGFRKLARYLTMPTLVTALLLLVSATKLPPCKSPRRLKGPTGFWHRREWWVWRKQRARPLKIIAGLKSAAFPAVT